MFKLHQPCHDKTCSCQMRTAKAFAVRCLDRVKPVLPQSRNFKNLATCSFCYWAGRFWALPGHKSPKTAVDLCIELFPFWFIGQDVGSDCISSWSLLIFLLYSLRASQVLGVDCTYWYRWHITVSHLLIHIGMSQVSHLLITDWYITVLPGTYWYRLVYHMSPRYFLIQIGMSQFSQVLNDTNWYNTGLPAMYR